MADQIPYQQISLADHLDNKRLIVFRRVRKQDQTIEVSIDGKVVRVEPSSLRIIADVMRDLIQEGN